MCIYVCICVYIYLYVCICVYLHVAMYLHMCMLCALHLATVYWLISFIISKHLVGVRKVLHLQSITLLWSFRNNLVENLIPETFFPTPKVCHIKSNTLLHPNKELIFDIERIKFVGLSLAVEILYTYTKPHHNQDFEGGSFLSVNCTRKCYVTWWLWVNNIKYLYNQLVNRKHKVMIFIP